MKRSLHEYLIVASSQGAGMAGAILLTAVVARDLSQIEFGKFVLIQGIAAGVAIGLHYGYPKAVVIARGKVPSLVLGGSIVSGTLPELAATWWRRMAAGLVALVALAMLSRLTPLEMAAAGVLAVSLTFEGSAAIQARIALRFGLAGFASGGPRSALAAVAVLMVNPASGATATLYVAAAGILAGILPMAVQLRTRSQADAFGSALGSVDRRMQLLMVGATHTATAKGDLWLAGGLLAATGLSQYAGASRFAVLFGVPLLLVGQLAAPRFAAAKDHLELERLGSLAALASISSTLPALIAVSVAPETLIRLLLGSGFSSAVTPVRILAVAALTRSLVGPAGWLLAATNRPKGELHANVWSATSLLGAAIVIGRTPTGLATAVLIAAAVQSTALYFATLRAGFRLAPMKTAANLAATLLGREGPRL